MNTQQENVIQISQLDQRCPEKRSACQVKWFVVLFGESADGFGFALVVLQGTEIHELQAHPLLRQHHLNGIVFGHAKNCAKSFVTSHDGIQGLFQRLRIKSTGQTDCERGVIERAVRLELIQEPQSLLSKGERRVSVPGYRKERRKLTSQLLLKAFFYPRRKRRNRRRLK